MSVKILLFPLSLIILIWSFVSFTKPAWDAYNSKKDQLEVLKKKKSEISRGVANMQRAVSTWRQLSDNDKQLVKNALPINIDEDNLVAEINKSASQAGVIITEISTKKIRSKANSKCADKIASSSSTKKAGFVGAGCRTEASPVRVNLLAYLSYPALKDFLSKLDSGNRFIIPNEFSLTTMKPTEVENSEASGDLIKLDAVFDVYYKDVDKVVLSEAVENDVVMRDLLKNGLSQKGLNTLRKFSTGELFYPVEIGETGKENPFK